ncbi:MAG: AsmA family protein [Candidatus Methylomirabilota bacterium]
MGRALKWVGVGIGGLLVLAVLAALLLPALVNLERYRSLLAARVGKSLGREVAVQGLRVNLWRGIGAEATGVRVAEAPGFGSDPFLAADTLRIRVQLLPLLSGQLRIASLTLERPRIRVLRGADGRWSVDDLLRGSPAPVPARPAPEASRPGKGPPPAAILLSEVAIRDGEVVVAEHGRSAAGLFRLTGLRLEARQEALAGPIALQSRATLAGPGAGTILVSGQITPADSDGPRLDLRATFSDLETAAWQSALRGAPGAVSLSGTLAGALSLEGPPGKVAFAGQLDLSGMGVRIGDRFEKPAGEAASLELQGRRNEPGLQVSTWRLRFRDTAVEGSLRVPDLARPSLRFTASAAAVDVDRLLRPPKRAGAFFQPASAWAAPPAPASGGGPDAEGTLRVEALTHAGLTWQRFEADLRYQGGVLRAPRIRAALLGGTVRATAEVDFTPRSPRVTLTSQVEEIATDPLVKALRLGAWSLQSRLSLDAQVGFVGFALPEILGSAAGRGSLRLGKGRIQGYRPLDRLAEVLTPILAAQGVRTRLHEFTELTGTFTLDNGILRSRDLTLVKPEGTIGASGSLGILDRALNADVVARLGRATVEARLAGTVDQPIVVPKLFRRERQSETTADPAPSDAQGKSLKDLFKRFFRR